jgi:hypothetical protein
MSTPLIYILLLLLSLQPGHEKQGVGIQVHVQDPELMVTAQGATSLSFSAKGPITSGTGKVSIDLQDAYTVVYALQYPGDRDVDVVINADADLLKEGAPTVKIPLTVKAAYNIGAASALIGKTGAEVATNATFTIPAGNSPSTVTTYLYIYGDMGPAATSYTPGSYLGDINLSLTLSESL